MTYDIPPWTPDPDFWKISGPDDYEDAHYYAQQELQEELERDIERDLKE